MGDRLRACTQDRYVARQLCQFSLTFLRGSLNRVRAVIDWGLGGNVTSAGWHVPYST